MGDNYAGCSLVVMIIQVYQSDFNRIIIGYFSTPQKASVGMYIMYVYSFTYFRINQLGSSGRGGC